MVVGVPAAVVAVGDAAPPVLDVGVACVLPEAGVACCGCVNGHACKFTGKFVQLPLVQIFNTTGVLAGPLQSTTCLPLFTSMVEQVTAVVVVVFVEGVGEVTWNVETSGKTSKACARLSTQNWQSTRVISEPVTGMAALVAVEPTTEGTWVETLCAPLAVGVSEPVVATAVVAVPGVPLVNPVAVPDTDVPNPRNGVLVSTMLVPDNVGVAFRFAPQAAVNNTSRREPHSNNLEILFISCLTFLLEVIAHDHLVVNV